MAKVEDYRILQMFGQGDTEPKFNVLGEIALGALSVYAQTL